ncbi:Ankyrin repeat [Dillenia turbinata]|uniref:Ankyrin repeat n=1 Tax=Dillenia turbinata TaxID=194707 RepID=A0AAN8ZNX7_9MAGN
MPETSQRRRPSPAENSILESLNSMLDSHLEILRSEALRGHNNSSTMDDEHEDSERSRDASRQQNENTLEGLLEGLRSLHERQQRRLRLSQERLLRNLRRNIRPGQGNGNKNVESRGETSGKQDEDDDEDTLETLLDKLHSEQESLLENLRSSQENMLKNLLHKLKKVGGRVNSLNLGEDVDPAINEGTRRNLNRYSPLYKAALKGDWERARLILAEDPGALTARITVSLKTALHVAAGAGHTQFVINLVNIMREEDLEIRDDKGHTALFFAAMAGCDASVRAMVTKNQNLTQIRNADNEVPVLYAALYGGKEVLQYLCSQTRDEDPSPFRGEAGGRLLNNIIASGYHDVALLLLKQYPYLATGKDESGTTALDVLAQRSIAFPSGNHLNFTQHLIYSCYRCMKDLVYRSARCVPCVKRVYDTKLMNSQALELLKSRSASAGVDAYQVVLPWNRCPARACENLNKAMFDDGKALRRKHP